MSAESNRLGIYVHVPFCPHICPYCDFTKTSTFSKKDSRIFFETALKQMRQFFNNIAENYTHATLYFGGGTPGLFPADYFLPFLELAQKRFVLLEVSLETNPFTNSQKQLSGYRAAGFNRLTLGAQSLCPKTLELLGRKHTPQTVLENIRWAKQAGFEQVQVDLIYGLEKGLRTTQLESEIKTLVAEGATGISGYALTIEERTSFFGNVTTNDDGAADEFEQLYKTCLELGMAHLETSNFSYFPALHNNIYWYGQPYLGIGTGAHGLLPPSAEHPYGQRYRVGHNRGERSPGNDKLDFLQESEVLFELIFEEERTQDRYRDEMIFTLLRTSEGLPSAWLHTEFGPGALDLLGSDLRIKRALEASMIFLDTAGLRLSWNEKLRGDAWAVHIAMVLTDF